MVSGPNINYAVSMVSRYQSNLGLEHCIAVNNILKYFKRNKHYSLEFGSEDLIVE